MLAEKKGKHGKRNNNFKLSIQKLIELCNKDTTEHYDMFKVSTHLSFHRRRFYDVINVLEVIGCCVKLDTDTFLWNGLGNVRDTITKMAYTNGVFSKDVTLDSILPNEDCISIGKVTEHFILTFLALQEHCLDIKKVSFYLSRYNNRSKTTLCKLYQITHIFESMGILTKTENTSEFRLSDEYFVSPEVTIQQGDSPYSIESLLNRQVPFAQSSIVKQRRLEFQAQQGEDKKLRNGYTSP